MQPTGVLVRALDDLPDGSGIDGIAYSYSNTTNYFTQTLGKSIVYKQSGSIHTVP